MKKIKLFIIKIGGHVIDNEKLLNNFLQQYAKLNGKKILIHGGGKVATTFAEKLKIKQTFINGRRVTDKKTLEVVTMVYAGLINKQIIAKLQSLKCNSIGISGVDGSLILSKKRINKKIDYGFVGDIQKCDSKIILNLLNIFDSIVVSPITVDKSGQLLNTNADSILKEVAKTCNKFYNVTPIICFEKNGVYKNISNPKTLLKKLTLTKYRTLLRNKNISNGMLPKLENCFELLNYGLKKVGIGNSKNLNKLVAGKTGTLITNE